MTSAECGMRNAECHVPGALRELPAFRIPTSEFRTENVVRRTSFTKLLRHDPRLPAELAEQLWADADGLMMTGRTLKAGDRTTVVRIDAGTASWVLKRYNLRGPLHTAAHLLMNSRARRNWRHGRRLLESGIATPRPMAYLEQRLGPLRTRSFLLTEFVAGRLLSDVLLRDKPAKRDRAPLPVRFADLWRRLGELRLTHGDTKSSNYLVTDDGRLWMIDLDSMRFHPLEATFQLARRRDWQRFMRNWRPSPELAESFRAAVETSKHIWIAPAHFRTLATARLAEFDAMMDTTDGHVLRRLADRENWRLDLVDDAGQTRRAYLKKHRFRTATTRLRARLGLGPGRTAGRVEADHVRNLTQQGVATMSLIAFGERLDADGRLASFLLTEELAGYTQLDLFLDERFPVDRPGGDPHLRELTDRVAEAARRFHRLGYNHRDFYTCHFFIREPETGRFDVHLIDLQRVQHRKRLRRRWVVKDLAQLVYSAPPHCIGNREKMSFIKGYLGVDKLHRQDKRFIRSILARERRMRRKLGPYR